MDTKKTGIILFLIFLSCTEINYAQGRNEWHAGYLVTKDCRYLQGYICINEDYDIALFRSEDKVIAYTPQKINSIKFFDKSIGLERWYISLDPENKLSQKPTHFFELVCDGQIKIVRRMKKYYNFENHVFNPSIMSENQINSSQFQNVNQFEYYYIKSDKIYTDRQFAKKVFSEMVNYFGEELIRYINTKNLDIRKIPDQIALIKYYNRLFRKTIFDSHEILSKNNLY